jgi:AAA domain
MTLAEVLPLLGGAKKVPSGWQARCPAHDDTHPSLSLDERNGELLLFCHAGCSFQQILGCLTQPSYRPPLQDISRHNGNAHLNTGNGNQPTKINRPLERDASSERKIISRRPVAYYDYTDDSGRLLYQTIRIELEFDNSSTDKTFSVRRKPVGVDHLESNGWIYDLKGVNPVLYRLSDLTNAALVYVVEGEKDVDNLRGLGVAATCNPFGAGKWKPIYDTWLKGKTVVILPDNDEAGRRHAEMVATSVFGIATEVFVINLPGLPEKGDVSDFLANGGTLDDIQGLVGRAEAWHGDDKPKRNGKLTFTPLSKLLAEPEEETAFVWDKTLPVGGLSICSAKPKVGKSTLARNLAVAVAKGEPFLGRETKKGKVLYLCLEEKRSEIRNHFERMSADSDNILIYTGDTPANAMDEIAIAIAEHEPALAIIDPLSRVLRVPDFNDYGSMSRAFEPIIDLARNTGCHIMALHHDSKMDRSGGEALLGSTAIFGAVDCHIQLRKREQGRTISTIQRYGEDLLETVVVLDKEKGTVVGQGDLQSFVLSKAKQQVIESFQDDEQLTESQIKERVEGINQGTISKALRKAMEDNLLSRTGGGKKNNPFLYSKATIE